MPPTVTRLYADTFLPDGGTTKFIADRREQEKPASWRRIALELRDLTKGQVDVTPETIRKWASEPAQPAA